ncbi:hypothetical protein [Ralstonia pseudosolanacearum]|uniref:hypothetical protein n=1 Tax=Ralstonia pseudosolanacearum TaxID=1310165 RepID=UPI001FFB2003|nr:hypothetical protein [Ralstonia pseudosolanacearum]
MSYLRVIPRDLFNEANLLKCYGRLYINLENLNAPDVSIEHDGEAFDVYQCQDDGSTTLCNVTLCVRGNPCTLLRPLNSRDAWPLYARTADSEVPVFDDSGDFTADMVDLLRGGGCMTPEQEIKAAMARAFFVSAYADAWDDAQQWGGVAADINPAGRDWMELAPEETDPAALRAADTLAMDVLRANAWVNSLPELLTFLQSSIPHGGERPRTAKMLGHYLAMQAMGSGVGLCDAFGKAAHETILVPYVEFGAHSLFRDYFSTYAKRLTQGA